MIIVLILSLIALLVVSSVVFKSLLIIRKEIQIQNSTMKVCDKEWTIVNSALRNNMQVLGSNKFSKILANLNYNLLSLLLYNITTSNTLQNYSLVSIVVNEFTTAKYCIY